MRDKNAWLLYLGIVIFLIIIAFMNFPNVMDSSIDNLDSDETYYFFCTMVGGLGIWFCASAFFIHEEGHFLDFRKLIILAIGIFLIFDGISAYTGEIYSLRDMIDWMLWMIIGLGLFSAVASIVIWPMKDMNKNMGAWCAKIATIVFSFGTLLVYEAVDFEQLFMCFAAFLVAGCVGLTVAYQIIDEED